MSTLITVAIVLGSIVALLLALRYVPGLKCISYCQIKQYKFKRSIKKLDNMCEKAYCTTTHEETVKTVNCDHMSLKKLIKLYNNTAPFGCNSFNAPDKTWVIKARGILAERIAERQILEV